MQRWRTATHVLAVAVLAGCTTLSPIERAERVYTGRFAAAVGQGEQRESTSGRFVLAVRSGGITIDLASPLGNTLARVRTTPEMATLTAPQPDGSLATWEGASPEALTDAALGWRLPVSGLADWLAGRPMPDRPARLTPAGGVVQQIDQEGWVIRIEERFEGSGEPRLLSLERAAEAAAPAIRLRLVVDEANTPVVQEATQQ
jgi:outer membrane lipoprotein LolB